MPQLLQLRQTPYSRFFKTAQMNRSTWCQTAFTKRLYHTKSLTKILMRQSKSYRAKRLYVQYIYIYISVKSFFIKISTINIRKIKIAHSLVHVLQ